MRFSRRSLPPMSLLCAFEASARLQSFTAAAQELHLTQSAVSRQIRALEELLGMPLFTRERQTVRLNPQGQAYAPEVREALQRLSAATLGCQANPEGGVLRLAILPTFGTRWLAPRLPDFLARHGHVTLHLSTQLAPFDFQLTAADAAIHFGPAQWPGAELQYLMPETVVAVCHRALRERLGLGGAQDLLTAPLLHLASRPGAWAHWLKTHGVDQALPVQAMQFDQFATMAQAAQAGLGVALLPRFLFQQELAYKDLVPALGGMADAASADAYYLAWPIGRSEYPPLKVFKQWLAQQATATQEA